MNIPSLQRNWIFSSFGHSVKRFRIRLPYTVIYGTVFGSFSRRGVYQHWLWTVHKRLSGYDVKMVLCMRNVYRHGKKLYWIRPRITQDTDKFLPSWQKLYVYWVIRGRIRTLFTMWDFCNSRPDLRNWTKGGFLKNILRSVGNPDRLVFTRGFFFIPKKNPSNETLPFLVLKLQKPFF